MRLAVFGLGYVGAVSCGCLPEHGHAVIGVDIAADKVDRIGRGQTPIVEDELADLLARAHADGHVDATTDAAEAVRISDAALVCVGTPSLPSGENDATALERVVAAIGRAVAAAAPAFYVVINRSTCLPPVHRRLMALLEETSGRRLGDGVGYVCHPEFLREGQAVADFRAPAQVVFGPSDERSAALCRALYPGLDAPTVTVAVEEAALIKYADNALHAAKLTFANEIGMFAHALDVDARVVMDTVRAMEARTATRYLRPGGAFGGSCLPKDLRAVLGAARGRHVSLPLLAGVAESNRVQVERLLARIAPERRPAVGVVGLAFKEGTDDVRESPLVTLVERLGGRGHAVRVYDAHLALARLVGANRSFALDSIPHLADLLTDDLPALVAGADVLVVGHRLTAEAWARVAWRDDQRVFDLVGVDALRDAPGYEGLYWSRP